jgi:hypothetical protein
MTTMNPETGQAEVPRTSPRSRSRVRYNAAMKSLRRFHMYAGLALVPFVILYGATAFLFNHPDWFSDRSVRPITAEDAAGTLLESFPPAEELAARVIEALNRDRGTSRPVVLSRARAPSYSRDLALTARSADTEEIIFVELEGRVGTVRSAPIPGPASAPPWARDPLHLDANPAEAARDAVASIMARWGQTPDEVRIRNAPDLILATESDGATWRVAYNLQTGALTVRPWGPDLSTRRFLTGMHLACRYPSRIDVRWAWALMVDAMAVAMVFWGASGLLMWWQMKSLRRFGSLVLAASLVLSVMAAIGMHGMLGM